MTSGFSRLTEHFQKQRRVQVPAHVYRRPLEIRMGCPDKKQNRKIEIDAKGKPGKLQTDNGNEFLNRPFQKYLNDLNIHHLLPKTTI